MRLIKTLLVGTVLGLTALPALAKQDIVWWDFLSGGDGVRMKALIDAFNKEHPDIQVKGTTLEWGVPFYTKVRTVHNYYWNQITDENVRRPVNEAVRLADETVNKIYKGGEIPADWEGAPKS